MLIVALNCGSSSLKFALYEEERGGLALRVEGSVERINDLPALRTRGDGASDNETMLESAGYEAAVNAVIELIERSDSVAGRAIDVIGHRVVHGGARYRAATRIDGDVLAGIEEAGRYARLHNAPATAVIQAVTERLGGATEQVAVFDTAFHAEMPPVASSYAIPWELAERHQLLRFGFHGLAHRYMAEAIAATREVELASLRLITLQLGSGCSASAIEGGRSVDTSMGLTPLEGLMMGTRSGDVDPALPALLAEAEGTSIEEVEGWLNERSGLLGVSGRSADVRDLLAAEEAGDERASLALELFCYRVRKQIGAYLAVLGGADAIAFGGGIGEHQPEIRRRILQPLEWLGIPLDPARNTEPPAPQHRITKEDATIHAYVVEVDEQLAIATTALEVTRA